jgi:hypothetical protein
MRAGSALLLLAAAACGSSRSADQDASISPDATLGWPPFVSDEITIAAPMLDGPAIDGQQKHASIAASDSGWLAVWEDSRGAPPGQELLYYTRFDADGTVLDPGGIPLDLPPQQVDRRPSVASNGDEYFVVFVTQQLEIYGVRISAAGELLTPQGIPLVSGVPSGSPAITSNGVDYAVAWLRDDWSEPSHQVEVLRVSPTGEIDGYATLDSSSEQLEGPAIASDGTDYLVSWTRRHEQVLAANIPGTGPISAGVTVVGDLDFETALAAVGPSVASDGTNYLVTWRYAGDIHGARVSASGVLMDALAIQLSTGELSEKYPAVTWTGSDYLVAWNDGELNSPNDGTADILAARVSSAGAVVDDAAIAISTSSWDETDVTLAGAGDRALILWKLEGIGLVVTEVAAGVVAPPYALFSGSYATLGYDVASNGNEYLVVWADARGSAGVYGARIAADGTVLAPGTFLIRAIGQPLFERLAGVTVESNGTDYLVLWTSQIARYVTPIMAARVSAAGEVLDPVGLPVAADKIGESSLASDGVDYFVAWGAVDGLRGTTIGADGLIATPEGALLSSPGPAWSCSVASNGNGYLVAWQDCRDCDSGLDRGPVISVRLLASDGTPQAAELLVSGGDATPPQAAYAGGTYLVVWTDNGARTGALMTPDGELVHEFSDDLPRIGLLTSTGNDYLSVWQQGGARLVRLSSEGIPLDGPGFLIAEAKAGPTAYHAPSDSVLLVYLSNNLVARLVRFAAP